MSFLTPAAFLLGLLLPVIVAMYLLKLRRTEQVVPSVYLWRKMVRDVEANAPWQRLRRNLLLILQLLFLLALIFALARPFTWAEGAGGQAAILILDTSASMGATDATPNRIEAAKEQARSLIGGLPEETRLTLITAGEQTNVLLASSTDRRQALRALDGVQPGIAGSAMTLALELASAIAARQPDTEIIVLSDGGFELPERLALKGSLRYLPIGTENRNQAITALNLENTPGGGLNAFIQVTNTGAEPANRRLALYTGGRQTGVNGLQLHNVYDLAIQPGASQAVLVDDLPPETETVAVRLEPSQGGTDDLPADDNALAVRRSGEEQRVVLLTRGNLFLLTALELLPGIQVEAVDPQDYDSGAVSLEGAAAPALTILDAALPLTASLPAGNLLFVAPPRSTEYFTVTGQIFNPAPRPAQPDDPLLSYVTLADVHILDASEVPLPEWARPIIAGDLAATAAPDAGGSPAETASTPLLFAGEVQGRRVAVLTFDLRRSDLPLQVAFPLLWANLVGWLTPGAAGGFPAQLAPGEALPVALPPDVASVRITAPDGSATRVTLHGGQATFAGVDQLGLYTVQWEQGGEPRQARFAVNLFDPQESHLEPAGNLPGLGGQAAGQAAEQQARREWWRPLAALALGLLTAEWLVYQRAGLARLRDRLRTFISGNRNPSGRQA